MTIERPGDVIALVNSTYATDLFIAVISGFDLFTRLAGRESTSAAELSELLEIDERAADVTLTYLVAQRLLERLPSGAVKLAAPAHEFLVEGTEPNVKQISNFVERSLMLVTALSPVIGYDKASQIAHYALDHDLTLKQAALQLAAVSAQEFDRIVDPQKMTKPYVAMN